MIKSYYIAHVQLRLKHFDVKHGIHYDLIPTGMVFPRDVRLMSCVQN